MADFVSISKTNGINIINIVIKVGLSANREARYKSDESNIPVVSRHPLISKRAVIKRRFHFRRDTNRPSHLHSVVSVLRTYQYVIESRPGASATRFLLGAH